MWPDQRSLAPAQLWTAAIAAAADHHTIHELGLPSAVLMERAALCVSAEVQRWLAGARLPVVALCGPGNNGGDGVAVARQLRARGVEARVVMVTDKHNAAVAQQLGLARMHGVSVEIGLARLPAERCLIIDALLGTGARGAPRGGIAQAIAWVREQGHPVVAVDVPSGVDPDTGAVPATAIEAELTVTFQRSKPGLHTTPGRRHAGRVIVAEIGLMATNPTATGTLTLIDPRWVRDRLAGLPTAHHKGQRGHVGLVAGSGGTPGAAVIAGAAALRAGAGLVTVASDDMHLVAEFVRDRPELMVEARHADSLLRRADALVVGPGLTTEASRVGLARLYVDDPRPAIWDASGLDEVPMGEAPAGPRVITPHPGEAARLLSRASTEAWDAARVQSDRVAAARELARLTFAVAVLKGEGSIVAGPASQAAICATGGPALATAGSGDALAGLIGALLGRGLDAWEAARIGVHVHGLAGEQVARSHPGSLAMDIADALGDASQAAAQGQVPASWPRLRLG